MLFLHSFHPSPSICNTETCFYKLVAFCIDICCWVVYLYCQFFVFYLQVGLLTYINADIIFIKRRLLIKVSRFFNIKHIYVFCVMIIVLGISGSCLQDYYRLDKEQQTGNQY